MEFDPRGDCRLARPCFRIVQSRRCSYPWPMLKGAAGIREEITYHLRCGQAHFLHGALAETGAPPIDVAGRGGRADGRPMSARLRLFS